MFNIKDIQWELRNSAATKQYGLIITLCHVLLAVNWLSPVTGFKSIFATKELLCWPIFSPCQVSDFLSLEQAQIAIWIYLSLAVFSFILILSYRFCSVGVLFLLATTAFGTILYLQDYRLHSPIILALFCLSLAFVIVPIKRYTSKNLLLMFFIVFGLSKLNLSWLENNYITNFLNLPPEMEEMVSLSVAFLETFLPLLLLFKGRLFTIGFSYLLLYNLFEVFAFDFWFGLIKISLLFIFLSFNHESKQLAEHKIHFSYDRPEPSKLWIPFSLIIFLVLLLVNLNFTKGHTSPFSFFKNSKFKSCKTIGFSNTNNIFKEIDFSDINSANTSCDTYEIEYKLNKKCDLIPTGVEHQFYLELVDLNSNSTKHYFKNYCNTKKVEI